MTREGSDKLARDEANDLFSSDKVDGTTVCNRDAERLGSVNKAAARLWARAMSTNPDGERLGPVNKAAARLWARKTGTDPVLPPEAEVWDAHSQIQGAGMGVWNRAASSTAKRGR